MSPWILQQSLLSIEDRSETSHQCARNVASAGNQHRWRFHRARRPIHLLFWLAVLNPSPTATARITPDIAKVLTMDEARRIASNAKLPLY